ncbi:MAG: VCBS repeat-containing protein, partial [Bacteroidetes bacterium]
LPSQLLRNDTRPGGPVRFTDITAEAAPALLKAGMVTDAIWADLDGNQTPDLMIAGEWMPLTLLLNEQGKLRDASIGSGLESSPGWWNRLAAADLDRDGDMDFIAGNLGLNALCTATPREPMEIYAADFDNNQSVDPVMAIYTNNGPKGRGLYPMHTRDDLIKQLLVMRRRFPTYAGYGEAPFASLFTPEESGLALRLRATCMESSWVENLGTDAQGKLKFALHALPQAAQIAPLMGILPEDVDGDGWPDLLLIGNRFDTEVFAGRYDAFNGLVLQNDQQGGFVALPPSATGFFVKGDARALLALEQAGGKRLYVASQNRDSLRVFTRISPPKTPLQ